MTENGGKRRKIAGGKKLFQISNASKFLQLLNLFFLGKLHIQHETFKSKEV